MAQEGQTAQPNAFRGGSRKRTFPLNSAHPIRPRKIHLSSATLLWYERGLGTSGREGSTRRVKPTREQRGKKRQNSRNNVRWFPGLAVTDTDGVKVCDAENVGVTDVVTVADGERDVDCENDGVNVVEYVVEAVTDVVTENVAVTDVDRDTDVDTDDEYVVDVENDAEYVVDVDTDVVYVVDVETDVVYVVDSVTVGE